MRGALDARGRADEAAEAEVRLRQRSEIGCLEVLDRDVQSAGSLGRDVAVDEYAPSLAVLQLQLVDENATRSPANGRRMRGDPARAVEPKRQITEVDLAVILVQHEIATGAVLLARPLIDRER